jgi:hypothetical protein
MTSSRTLSLCGEKAYVVRARLIQNRRQRLTNAQRAETPLTLDDAIVLGRYAEDLIYKAFGIEVMIDHALNLSGAGAVTFWDEIRGCIMQLPEEFVTIRDRRKRLGPPATSQEAWDILKNSDDSDRRVQAIHKLIDIGCLLENCDLLWRDIGVYLMDIARPSDLQVSLLYKFAKYTPFKTMASWAVQTADLKKADAIARRTASVAEVAEQTQQAA